MLRITVQDIVRSLQEVISDSDRVIVFHSNVFSFGFLEHPIGQVMDALFRVLKPHQTLLMPTFTLSFCRTGWYHSQETASETGALTEYFRNLPGVRRTPCPINSFASFGPATEYFMKDAEGETCWGKDSIYQAIYDQNALVVGFGEHLALKGSIFHYGEEQARVPYRYFKTFRGRASYEGIQKEIAKKMYVRRLDVPVKYEYSKVIQALSDRGTFRKIRLGMSFIEIFRTQDAIDTFLGLLEKDPLAALSNRSEYEAVRAQKTVVFAGSSNLNLTAKDFCEEYRKINGMTCRAIMPPFGQYRQEVLNPESSLRVSDPDYFVFLERAEDLLGRHLIDPVDCHENREHLADEVRSAITAYVDFIRHARSVLSGKFFVANFEPLSRSLLGSVDGRVAFGNSRVVDIANAFLLELTEGLRDTFVLDFRSLVKICGIRNASGKKYWHLGKIPFSKDFSSLLSREITGMVLAVEERTSRLIVLDLDNTLWGGTIGEDGMQGIQLGGDYPGNTYRDFQIYLKSLSRRGVALAVCSKNTEEVALQAIREHPEMVLREEDFAEIRINWEDKATNILSICKAVSLNPGSILFWDDSPVEREWVRRNLPECVVPEVPTDVSDWPEFLASFPYLQTVRITTEDFGRTHQYFRKRKMEEFKGSFESVDHFLEELGMQLFVERYGPHNMARVLQLLAKTNQFNLTTQRYSQSDLDRLLSREQAEIFAVGLKDRFFEKEKVGVLIIIPQDGRDAYLIDSFLLSCRVLGRKIETALLGWLASYSWQKGKRRLVGVFEPTGRNQIVEGLYGSHRFSPITDRRFVLELDSSDLPEIPKYFEVIEDKSAP